MPSGSKRWHLRWRLLCWWEWLPADLGFCWRRTTACTARVTMTPGFTSVTICGPAPLPIRYCWITVPSSAIAPSGCWGKPDISTPSSGRKTGSIWITMRGATPFRNPTERCSGTPARRTLRLTRLPTPMWQMPAILCWRRTMKQRQHCRPRRKRMQLTRNMWRTFGTPKQMSLSTFPMRKFRRLQ